MNKTVNYGEIKIENKINKLILDFINSISEL